MNCNRPVERAVTRSALTRACTVVRLGLAAACCALSLQATPAAAAPAVDTVVFKTLHEFDTSQGPVGSGPLDLTLASDGFLYGVTDGGGVAGAGTLYRIGRDGAVEVLHDFGVQDGDGTTPRGAVIEGSDGSFYGTTELGGANGFSGTVYRYAPDGTYTVLHSFTGNPDGENPMDGLVQATDGNYYGTTYSGGTNWGTVFRMTPDGVVSMLHAFQPEEGHFPIAALIQAKDGLLYGTTREGGHVRGSFAQGTVFSLSLAGDFVLLHSFSSAQGIQPWAPLVQASNGAIYGTTAFEGPKGGGTLFMIEPGGHVKFLHAFPEDAADGANPMARLTDPGDGYLYGTTVYGGTTDGGVVFRLGRDGTETVLHEFDTGSPEGVRPIAGLTPIGHGILIGTTGGAWRSQTLVGTIFGIEGERR